MTEALALLVAWTLGAALVGTLVGPRRSGPGFVALTLGLGGALGMAVSAAGYFIHLHTTARLGLPYPPVELGCAAAGVLLLWRHRRRPNRPADPTHTPRPAPPPPSPGRAARLATTLCVAAALLAAGLALHAQHARLVHEPHGQWDAWAMWNAKARFLHRGEHDGRWVTLFDTLPKADYGLLQPAGTARLWSYAGRDTPVGPRLWALGSFAAVLLTLAGVLHRASGPVAASLGVLVLLTSRPYLTQAASQYADLTVSLYVLAAVGCATLALREGKRLGVGESLTPPRSVAEATRPWWVLAGATASAGAWTKNEGIAAAAVLALVVLGVLAVTQPRRVGRAAGWLAAGALPLGLVVAFQKIAYAGAAEELTARPPAALADLLADPERHRPITSTFARIAGQSVDAWLAAALLGLFVLNLLTPRPRPGLRLAAVPLAVAAAMLGVFYAVYLTTPSDLAWHLQTSADRVLLQLWPVATLGAVLLVLGVGFSGDDAVT